MTVSEVGEYNNIDTSNSSVPLLSTTFGNVTSVDACGGAGTYADGSCRTVWPFWVEVAVPLCCVVLFLLTLVVVYLRPGASTGNDDICKQKLNDSARRTECDRNDMYKKIGETSLDTKV